MMKKREDRGFRREDRKRRTARFSILYLLSSILCLLPGCTYNSTATAPDARLGQERKEAALNDPINYKQEEDTKPYDISGGGFNNLDRNALKKDFDHVLDP